MIFDRLVFVSQDLWSFFLIIVVVNDGRMRLWTSIIVWIKWRCSELLNFTLHQLLQRFVWKTSLLNSLSTAWFLITLSRNCRCRFYWLWSRKMHRDLACDVVGVICQGLSISTWFDNGWGFNSAGVVVVTWRAGVRLSDNNWFRLNRRWWCGFVIARWLGSRGWALIWTLGELLKPC